MYTQGMPARAQPPERRRLAQAIEDRRTELRMTLDDVGDAAGIHPETVARVRDGSRPIRKLTRRGLEDALRWQPGSIQRILEGGDPIELPPEGAANPPELALTAEELEDEHVQVIMSIPDVPKNILIPYAKKAYQLRQEQRRRAHEHHRRREAG